MRGRRFEKGSVDRVFMAAVLGLVSVLGVAGCGGVSADSGRRNGDGHRAGPSLGGGGSTAAPNGGAGNARGSGAASGSTPGGSMTGSNDSDSGAPGAGGASSSGDTRAGASGGDAGLPDPPRTTDLLRELDELHMDHPLSTIVAEKCPTSLALDWDLDRDGTTDATESRLFDASGRLMAAELSGVSTDGGTTARKRVRITYDGKGRPTQYLYGVEGTAALGPWIIACTSPSPGFPRGTVVDVDYSADGRVVARAVTTENCFSDEPTCETLVFDADGQFRRRQRGCDGQQVYYFSDQVREVDGQGRPHRDSATVPSGTEDLSWGSDIRYSYPAAETTLVEWNETTASPGSVNGSVQGLTKTFSTDGRVARMTMRVTGFKDTPVRDVVTYTYDPDGCGVTESTDLWNDGVADIVTTTSCTNGRVTHQVERNMTSTQDGNFVDRQVTPLWASAQSEVTREVRYDAAGRIMERSFQETTLQDKWDVNSSQHEVYTDDGKGNLTGKLDRSLPPVSDPGLFDLAPESSSSACTVTNACGAALQMDPERGRCEAGLGVTVVPAAYLAVPGAGSADIVYRPVPWLPVPVGFIDERLGNRFVIGF